MRFPLACLCAALAVAPARAAPPAPDFAEIVRAHVHTADLPGMVAVAFDGAGERSRVALGDCPAGPLSADKPLLIGSVSKTLTAQLVLALAAAHRIDLARPAAAYLPGLPPWLTVADLLAHRSGFTRAQGMRFDPAMPLGRLRPAGAPGRYAYSNLNYVLLGRIAAQASGQPYAQALATYVTHPAGMRVTSATGSAGGACGHAMLFGATIARAEPAWPGWAVPAGFIAASGSDMARFGGWLLRRARAGEPAERILTGWHRATIGGETVWSHSGETGSFRATIVLMPQRDRGFVLLGTMGGWLLQNPVDRLAVALVAAEQRRSPLPAPAWPWERAVRFAALLLLAIEVARLVRRAARAKAHLSRATAARAGAAVLIGAIVPLAIQRAAGLAAADLWRLAPDLFVLIWAGPALAALRLLIPGGPTILSGGGSNARTAS